MFCVSLLRPVIMLHHFTFIATVIDLLVVIVVQLLSLKTYQHWLHITYQNLCKLLALSDVEHHQFQTFLIAENAQDSMEKYCKITTILGHSWFTSSQQRNIRFLFDRDTNVFTYILYALKGCKYSLKFVLYIG